MTTPFPPCSRRRFVISSLALGAGALMHRVASATSSGRVDDEPPFKLSLAQWSLHRTFFDKKADPYDFARMAREDYDIHAVEYVNQFFMDAATDSTKLQRLKKTAADHGVTSLLIMCDGEGALGDPDDAKRAAAVNNHHKWVDAARFLGCHSIRVNAETANVGTPEEQMKRAAEGLRRLTDFATTREINVLVENHGGLSSNAAWLAGVMKLVDHPRCGTLPDFGNFCMDWSRVNDPDAWYDRYQGVKELMPFAKAVSAKSHDFDEQGNETGTDYARMIPIVLEAGYQGHLGIEYEGERLSEPEGIRATKALLERVREGIRVDAGG